jgi:hypothetical protein
VQRRRRSRYLAQRGTIRALADQVWTIASRRSRLPAGNVRVTDDKTEVPAVVCVRAENMKEPWCLATSRDDLTASEIVALYGRRFTIEENFRDTKDPRFGLWTIGHARGTRRPS